MSAEPLQPNIAGAIYGQILATALLVSLSEDPELGCGELLLWLAVTMFVLYLAHVYGRAMSSWLEPHAGLRARAVKHAMVEEWPLAEAAGAACVVLALGAIGLLSRDAAVAIGIGLGIVQLVGWGVLVARRTRQSLTGTLLAAGINAALGLALVALKVFVH